MPVSISTLLDEKSEDETFLLFKSTPEYSIPLRALLYGLLHKNINLEHLDKKVLLHISKLINPRKKDGCNNVSQSIIRFFELLSITLERYEISLLEQSYPTVITSILSSCQSEFVLINMKNCDIGPPLPMYSSNYKLFSAGISSSNHIIAGLMCNSIQYVFDSNNIMAKTNWVVGDLMEYYEKYMEFSNEPCHHFYNSFNFVFYVKDTTPRVQPVTPLYQVAHYKSPFQALWEFWTQEGEKGTGYLDPFYGKKSKRKRRRKRRRNGRKSKRIFLQ